MTPQDAADTAKAYLNQINRLDVHIRIYNSELSHYNKMQREYGEILDLSAMLRRQRHAYGKKLDNARRERQNIIDQLDALEDPTGEILKSIYVKHQTIYAIADRLYYGYSTIHKKHRDGLMEFYSRYLADGQPE